VIKILLLFYERTTKEDYQAVGFTAVVKKKKATRTWRVNVKGMRNQSMGNGA